MLWAIEHPYEWHEYSQINHGREGDVFPTKLIEILVSSQYHQCDSNKLCKCNY